MAVASVWGSIKQAETSLQDVMSEQMAVDLQNKENALAGLAAVPAVTPISVESVEVLPEEDVSSDLLLAQLMQDQLDRECDEMLQREQNKVNGDSKVSVSYEMYRLRHPYPVLESEEEEEDYDDDVDRTCEWDSFETRERDAPHIPRCGYTVHNDRMVTKHDRHIAGRKNACKVMDLPPNICTGDGGSFDMEINNGVLNALRKHARADGQRKHRVADKEDRATSSALDRPTRLMILKMLNSGVVDGVNGAISTGKEAYVFHARGGSSDEIEVPDECVLKVFKTTLNEFKTREKYIKADKRFKDRMAKQNPRRLIHLWAEKELCNLKRLTRAGVRCPLPLVLKEHVLLMSFIGEARRPAPKLKDVELTEKQWRDAYNQVLEMTKAMYEKCSLVHADLSEYNVLYHAGLCWFIDVSQSVEPSHPDALSFLYRDCVNVSSFFQSKGVAAKSAEEMFSHVSGLPLTAGDDVSEQIAELERTEQPYRPGQRRCDEAVLQHWLEDEDEEAAAAAGAAPRRRH